MTFGLGTACVAIAACLMIPTLLRQSACRQRLCADCVHDGCTGRYGLDSGALLGGLFVGLVESLCGLYLGESLGQIGIFLTFILVLFASSGLLVGSAFLHEPARFFFDHRGGRRAFSAFRSSSHHVKRGVELSLINCTPAHAGGAGLERARRLWRPIFLRPRRVFPEQAPYVTAILQMSIRFNAGVLFFAAGIAAGAGVGAAIGALTFPSGLRGPHILHWSRWPLPKSCALSPARP